jgi:dolichol-phosphate mannosyltransferase
MFSFSIIFIIKLLFDYYIYNDKLLGWTSIMVSIFFIGGLIFAYLAILGLYIGGVFKEVKHKPLYVVSKTMNLEEINDRK